MGIVRGMWGPRETDERQTGKVRKKGKRQMTYRWE